MCVVDMLMDIDIFMQTNKCKTNGFLIFLSIVGLLFYINLTSMVMFMQSMVMQHINLFLTAVPNTV